jgi:YD repeat-containing protein
VGGWTIPHQRRPGFLPLTPQQLALTASNTFVSISVTLGFGKPLWEFNFHLLPEFLLYSNLAGSFSILAAQLSKTSFAITVLRISSDWTRWLVWFIIISVNLALGLAITFTWIQCTPVERTWKPFVPGTCWDKHVVVKFNIFTAGTCSVIRAAAASSAPKLMRSDSLLRGHGHRPGLCALERHLDLDHEQEGEVWRYGRHEHGRVVSPTVQTSRLPLSASHLPSPNIFAPPSPAPE